MAAALAAILILGSYFAEALLLNDAPRSSILPALGAALEAGPAGEAPSLNTGRYEYLSERAATFIAIYVVRGLGFLLAGFALTVLAFATRARGPLPKVALMAPIVGAALYAIAFVVSPVGTVLAVNDFLDGPRTVDAARDVGSRPLFVAVSIIEFVARLAFAMGLILVSLHAMRTGLLTRFLGVLGMLSGALFLIPIGGPLPVVQCFWLGAFAFLLLGRWPGGDPPAWRTGRAEAWPSQQQVREQRERERSGGGKAADPRPVAAAVGARAGEGTPHPSSRKKKRKRRS
ncbi:MAG: hypothetical protein AVDCRST_MAG30-243 [uncultured Solirubrobacteraceae bacterium]|uniref:Uncharacterized protein n=1 Tax=uncultured Solirubrobacteraceae bacterium TaxID=1162706 RepID=A0A6J4RGD7_9ACTN|nr:MAG: hypothetical protein AVDCRST_MAG30-243 [uncultured Solirubrobacteraceae bacterium]